LTFPQVGKIIDGYDINLVWFVGYKRKVVRRKIYLFKVLKVMFCYKQRNTDRTYVI